MGALSHVSRICLIAVLLLASMPSNGLTRTCSIEKKATLPLGLAAYIATVPARINGQDVTLIFDTGAQTIVTPRTEAELGLSRDYGRQSRGIGVTAGFIAHHVQIRDLEFGAAHYRNKSVPVLAITAQQLSSAQKSGALVQGLLGADILHGFDIDVDFTYRTMTLYQVSGCSTITPAMAGNYYTAPIAFTADYGLKVPVKLDGHELDAIFDTGAYASALTRKAARKIGLSDASLATESVRPMAGVGDVVKNFPTHLFKAVSLSDHAVKNLRLPIIDAPIGADMLLGNDYMSGWHFWISYSTRKIFFQPPVFNRIQQYPCIGVHGTLVTSGRCAPLAFPPSSEGITPKGTP
jgi:predicted aspartyl protease